MTRKLTFERVLLWNPATKETKVEFHIFDPHQPRVLIERTTSIYVAEKRVKAGK